MVPTEPHAHDRRTFDAVPNEFFYVPRVHLSAAAATSFYLIPCVVPYVDVLRNDIEHTARYSSKALPPYLDWHPLSGGPFICLFVRSFVGLSFLLLLALVLGS
jgi:hypothetical protein